MTPIPTDLLQRTEKALRWLNKKRSDKFSLTYFSRSPDRLLLQWDVEERPIDLLSQDDIDEILALIGWGYVVSYDDKGDIWGGTYFPTNYPELVQTETEDDYATKRETAYACLSEVIETLFQKET